MQELEVTLIKKNISIGQYTSIQYLEQGSFITCFTALDINQQKVIVIISNNQKELQTRLQMSQKLQNVNQVQKYSVLAKLQIKQDTQSQLNEYYPNIFCQNSFALIGEFYENSFNSFIKNMTVQEKINTFRELLKIVKTLHENSVYHMDLKPSNIMIHDGELILIDFGQSVCESEVESVLNTSAYSPRHDVYACSVIPEKFDVYCLGNILHDMLVQIPLSTSLVQDSRQYKQLQDSIGNLAANIIFGMTTREQEQRYTVSFALNHPIFTANEMEQIDQETLLVRFLNSWAQSSNYSPSAESFIQLNQQLSQDFSYSDLATSNNLFDTRQSLYDFTGNMLISAVHSCYISVEDSLDL
ncbi:Kinase [Hexamita inflata]|uniref:CAMK CAMKL n=1 Tax=Hexamita inflata TaxID=28002 RepID=A0AA86QX86_9EUKA|nr:CAMK CAMKL [Hexamita inflata]